MSLTNHYLDKIGIGTIQFGIKYGINNNYGILSISEVNELLRFAYNIGVKFLDTAYSYEKSENIIGSLTQQSGLEFDITSKAPKNSNSNNINQYLEESLTRLHTKFLYGYLLHDFNDYIHDKDIINILLNFKKKQKVKKIGFSLYYPQQLEFLLKNGIAFDIIQVPYNLLDRRFEKYFKILNEKNIDVHIRSVFLQGLFFVEPLNLPLKLLPMKDVIIRIKEICSELNKTVENLAINFALQNENTNKIILGIENIVQLKKNLKEVNLPISKSEYDFLIQELNKFNFPQHLLIPMNWKN